MFHEVHMKCLTAIVIGLCSVSGSFAGTVSVELQNPTPISPPHQSPAGHSATQGDIAWDSASLLRNGKPWLPVMGEFHYSRYPNAEWRDELLKMKAGGITLVSTYVFWIHHEEEEDKFTWDGDKDLRKFIETCADVGLPVIVRVGPWCHGEVRNGGFPDWVQAMPRKRTNDPQYLAAVKPYYDQIGQQLKGLYWKDDGPIIGIQFENEFKGPAAHLVTLKQYGLEAGMDVPLYTRTAWDNATNVPTFGEVLPLWGGYAEGFWDRTLDTMPGAYWQVFQFTRDGIGNNAMGSDPTAAATGGRASQLAGYPYLTCELGGGMMSSYHRRIDIAPMDVYSVALTKIGSGSNMPGYYMFHGGTNPEGKLSTLMESQSPPQNMWNDMPIKNYDFGACLGTAGEVRDSYHLARRLHLFLNDWGEQLARMPATYAGVAKGKQDTDTLRWSVRSDGKSGFLFVNNYQRAQEMPAKPNTQFDIKLSATSEVKIPDTGTIAVPANSSFIWPFNLELNGANLVYATAQPLCKVDVNGTMYFYFRRTQGAKVEFVLDKGVTIDSPGRAEVKNGPDGSSRVIAPDYQMYDVRMHTADGKRQVLLLMEDDTVFKGTLGGKESVVIAGEMGYTFDPKGNISGTNNSKAYDSNYLAFDAGKLRFSTQASAMMIVMPPPESATVDDSDFELKSMNANAANITYMVTRKKEVPELHAAVKQIQPAGTLRSIPMGSQKVAAEPTDADFAAAATFKITLPPEATAAARKTLLRLHYTGDVARIYLDGKLILDDFYHGQPLDLALWRYPDLATKDLTIKILPLQKGAPIYMAKWPDFEGPSIAKIDSVDLLEQRTMTITAK